MNTFPMQTLQKNFWQEDETTRNIRWYLSTSRQLWLWSIGVLLFIYIISAISFLQWPSLLLAQIGWGIITVAVFWSVILVANTKRQEYAHAIITGFLGGIVLGLVHAIIQLIWFRSGWLLFNLIAEPLFAALAGAVIGSIVVLIWRQFNRLQTRSTASPTVNAISAEPVESAAAADEPIDLILTTATALESEEVAPVVIETVLVEPVTDIVSSVVETAPEVIVVPANNDKIVPLKAPSTRKKNTKSLARPRYARPSSKQKPSPKQSSTEADQVGSTGSANQSGAVKRRRRSVA